MSTKTTFKRVALVAVAALGLGVISVAPSSAAVFSGVATTNTLTMVSSSSSINVGETATATFTSSIIAGQNLDSVTIDAFATSANGGTMRLYVTDSSSAVSTTNVEMVDAGTASAAGDGNITFAAKAAGAVVVTAKLLVYAPSTPGTYTFSIYAKTGAAGAAPATQITTPLTWSFVVKAAPGPDATSTSFIGAGSTIAPTNADSTTISALSKVGTIAANIKTVQNTAGVATSTPESITATITGAGTLGVHASAPASASATGRSLTVKNSDAYVVVFADGTAGVGTVTLTGATTGYVYKTAAITFYSATPATVTATVKKAYPAAGKTTTSAVFVTVKDANGYVVQGANVDLEPATIGTGETTTACAFSATYNTNVCSIAGTSPIKFGKVSYKAHVTGADTAATEIYSTAFDVTFADIVATSVVLSAPATGSVGDKVTVTLTAKEKNGYPVADSTYEGGSANGSVGGIFWNTTTVPVYSSSSFKPFNSGETITTTSGVATVDLYLPAVSGTVTGSWTLAGTAGAGVTTGAIDKTISGSAAAITIAVTNPGVDAATDAANEATDAANAATDAALAAADAADAATAAAQDASDAVAALSATVAKLVASLKAQLTSLTNLVIKIQKKVRA
jgi:hypothetical protein